MAALAVAAGPQPGLRARNQPPHCAPARESAGLAGQSRGGEPEPAAPGPPCERELEAKNAELEAKNAENARLREDLEKEQDRRRQLEQRVDQLEQRVKELQRQLKAAQRRPGRW